MTRKTSPRRVKKTSPRRVKKTSPSRVKRTSPRRVKKTSPRRVKKTSPRRVKKTSPRRVKKTSPRRMNPGSNQLFTHEMYTDLKEKIALITVDTTKEPRELEKDFKRAMSNLNKRGEEIEKTVLPEDRKDRLRFLLSGKRKLLESRKKKFEERERKYEEREETLAKRTKEREGKRFTQEQREARDYRAMVNESERMERKMALLERLRNK